MPKSPTTSNTTMSVNSKRKESNRRKEVAKAHTRVSFSTSDKATRRVIAPYVKVIRKGQKLTSVDTREENKQFSFYLQKKPSVLMRNLSAFLSDTVDLTSLLHETAEVLKATTNASGVILYMVDQTMGEIVQSGRVQAGVRHRASWKIQAGHTVAAFVAMNKEFIMVDDVFEDVRFPEGAGWKGPTVKSVLCVPVVTPDNDCIAVIELYRDAACPPFVKEDLKIVIVAVGWMGAAIHQNTLRLALQKQQELNDYLLNITKCYFSDMLIVNKLITELLRFAKTTLNAERGSFYIIDKDNEELVADLYEEGITPIGTDPKIQMHKKKMKIKLSREMNIAGIVARTGETINVQDAYNDPRFNKEVDARTLCITRSILCMPIRGVESILGVIQVVNKTNGPCFTAADENLFQTFSVYCSLALHYAHLHQTMAKTDKINKIYQNMLQFHMKPFAEDVMRFRTQPHLDQIPDGFNEFAWYVTPDLEVEMPQLVLYMIEECVGEPYVNIDHLMDVILMVKKSYRSNPYHNWHHAFNVCHCMYNILTRNSDVFSPLEIQSLILAAICHDIDHQGFTNNFLQTISDPLVQLYEESPLENHHYHVTMTIIKDIPVFTNLDRTTYRAMATEIHDAILATDLAAYFKSRTRLIPLITDYSFDWHNVGHRTLLKAIMMTAADLSGQCKPYHTAKKITDDLYREFYHQGDVEKAMSLTPLSMMDRDKQYMVPDDQVQFLTVVVLPCVELLSSLLPNTDALAEGCRELKDTWKDIIEMRGQKVWKPDDSYVKPE